MNNKAIKAFVSKFKNSKCPDFRFDLINNLFHDWSCNLDNISSKGYDDIWYTINQKLPFFSDGYYLTNDAWIEYVSGQTISIAEQSGTELENEEQFLQNASNLLKDADLIMEFPSLVLEND